MELKFIRSTPAEAKKLTEISFKSKKTWNYPEHYFDIWEKELTISGKYIQENTVYSCYDLSKDILVGFYSIIENPEDRYYGKIFIEKGFWLEHIFILPEYQFLGIGRKMILQALKIIRSKRQNKLWVFVDPNAIEFYKKNGAKFFRNSKSSIPDREIPVFLFYV